jgi:8-oxo-dGTP pyrophosphatase MutT (NUDIX family)
MSGPSVEIVPVQRVDITVGPWPWEFAVKRRAEIDAHFAVRQERQPALWNGRVVLLKDYRIESRVLSGSSFETDFASFVAWRDWNFPDRDVFNVFAMAAVRAADGGYLLGQMGAHTASAGLLYFPCGTPDLDDVTAGRLDLEGSAARELLEETGIDIATLSAEPGWSMVRQQNFIALIKKFTSAENERQLRARVLRYLASAAHPELSDIRMVRGGGDLTAQVPAFVAAFLENAWQDESHGRAVSGSGGKQ